MKCLTCGRPLTDRTSLIRGRGATCFARHCEENPQDAMTGYTWRQTGKYEFTVCSPAGSIYQVKHHPTVTCDCASRQDPCKHVLWLNAELTAQAVKPHKTDAEVELMMKTDFPS